MRKANEGAQLAIAEAEAMARRPSPQSDWAPVDELLYRWRRNVSSGQSAIARALGDHAIWDSTWPDQLSRAFESHENSLRPQPMVSLRPADLVAIADQHAKARSSALIGEQDLVTALLSKCRTNAEGMGIRVDRLLEMVKAAEDDPVVAPVQTVGVAAAVTDVFISHAGEDSGVAGPLADELTNRGYKVWYDRYVLRVGDSLRRQIDDGLAKCRFGIVILSHSFFAKPWPQTELDGLAARENSGGGKVILPVWHGLDHADVLRYSVTLADKVGIPTSRGMSAVADEIVRVLRDEARVPPPGEARPLLHSFAAPDAKRDRLQPAYAALLRAAKAAEQIAGEFHLRDGETKDQRGARWDAALRPLKLAADQAIIDLELETGTDDVIKAFVGAWNTFVVYRMDFTNNELNHGSVPNSEFARHREELRASVIAVADTARRHLAEFDQRERPPVHVEVRLGLIADRERPRQMLMVTVSNDTDRPQRVDTVAVVLSGLGGDLVIADPAPFPPTPQMVTETQSYTTGFDLEALKVAAYKQREIVGDAQIRPVGVRVRLASGRTVEADARHIEALAT